MTEGETMAALAPMPEDWERGLAIFAHPDDKEYGASSAFGAWTDAGNTNGVRWVALSGSPFAPHAVDITDTLERGITSLAAHRVYLEGLGDGFMSEPAAFLRSFAEQTASQFNGRLATSFELLEM